MEIKTRWAQDKNGKVIPFATVSLFYEGTTDLVEGLETKDGGPLSNPFQSDVNGKVVFAAPDGQYDIKFSSGPRESTASIQFLDVSGALQVVENIDALRSISGNSGRDYILAKFHTSDGDGGGGNFYWESGAAPGTYVDNNGTIIVPTGGDGSAAWMRESTGSLNVKMFGKAPGADVSAILAMDVERIVVDGAYSVSEDVSATATVEFGNNAILTISAALDLASYHAIGCPFLVADGGILRGEGNNLNFKEVTASTTKDLPQVNLPYDITSHVSAAVDVGTFTTADIPLVIDDTGLQSYTLMLQIKYTGILNAVRLQQRTASSYISQAFGYISGASSMPSSLKARFTDDGVEKVSIVQIPLNAADIANTRYIRLIFNDTVADQDASFTLTECKYGYVNSKSVSFLDLTVPVGKRMIAIRGYWSGESRDTNVQVFYDTESDAKNMIGEANYWNENFTFDVFRFPIWIKNLTDPATERVIPEKIRYLKMFLNHINSLGKQAIIELNHFFSNTSLTQQWLYSDIDSAAKAESMARRAANVVADLNHHPSVRIIELDNEVNLSHAIGANAAELVNTRYFYQKLSEAVRGVTSKPLSTSMSGTLQSTYYLPMMLDLIDIVDLHGYGAPFSRLAPLNGKPIICTEMGTATELVQVKNRTITYGPWHSYINEGSSSFEEDLVEEFRSLEVSDSYAVAKSSGDAAFTHHGNIVASTYPVMPRARSVIHAMDGSVYAIVSDDGINVSPQAASISDVRAGTGEGRISSSVVTSSLAVVALADAGTVAVNGAAFINASLSIAANRTLGNMTSKVVGRTYTLRVASTSSSPWDLSLGAEYIAAAGLDLTGITNVAGNRLLLRLFVVDSSTVIVSGERY